MFHQIRHIPILGICLHEVRIRYLNDHQRNMTALKYEELISKRMKERQATSTGGVAPQLMTNWSEAGHTTTRAELAKIAGTSQGSVQRSKLILTKRTTVIFNTNRFSPF